MLDLVRKPVIVLGLTAFVAVPIWWYVHPGPFFVVQGGENPPASMTSLEKHVALKRAGLDAQTLAAAGVNSTGAGTLAQAAAQYCSAHPTALKDADAAYASARTEADRLLRLVQAGKASVQDVAAYQTAKTTLANAEASRTGVLDAIFEASTAGLTTQQRTLLSTIRANASHSDIPVQYRTVTRSKADWVQLRDDLVTERTGPAEGSAPYVPGQTRLATVRADGTVASATTSLGANQSGIQTALNNTLGSPSNH